MALSPLNSCLFRDNWSTSIEETFPRIIYIEGQGQKQPPLILAVIDEDIQELRKLLEMGYDPNVTSHHGGIQGPHLGRYTALLIASMKGKTEMVKLLLKAGADPFKGQFYRQNPIEWARAKGHQDIVELLLNPQRN